MPIIKKYNLLFIHIPKTAGTSIEAFFNIPTGDLEELNKNLWDAGKYYDLYSPYISTKWDRDNIFFEPQHWTPKIIKEYLKEDYNNYFKFCFIRNPYTKLLSEFYSNPFRLTNPTMEEFNKWLPIYLTKINHSHKLPQFNYIDNSINFIGKYENLQKDFSLMVSKLGLNIDSTLLKENISYPSNKESLISSISRSNLDLINTIYKKDFINFGYKFM